MYQLDKQFLKTQIFSMSVGMSFLCFLSLVWIATIPEAKAQSAEFSTETGILDVPLIEINGQRTISEAELQLQGSDPILFQLVDYAFDAAPDVQQLALDFNESIALDDSMTMHFIDVLAESRCPLDVLCITSGEVTVILRIIETLDDGNTSRTDFGLTLGGLDTSVHYFRGSYYRLIEANPYPVSTVTVSDEDYAIVVEKSTQSFLK